jgi:hypothetical protein
VSHLIIANNLASPPLIHKSFTYTPFLATFYRAYTNLAPKTRLGVGAAIIAWGCAGLYLSDKAEEKFGYTPTEEDKSALRDMAPKITTVEKNQEVLKDRR